MSGDEISITVTAPWSVEVNGEVVASSGDVPPPEPGPEPTPGAWPKIPQSMVDTALSFATFKYGNKGNSSSNVGAHGTAMLAPIYGYLGGDERSSVRDNVMASVSALTSGDKGPCGMNGPGAAQETYALAFFHCLRRSDLWAGLTDTVKARIDAIFHATALIRAWEGNDSSASHGETTITGGLDNDYKDIGPNISFTIPAGLILCAEWFGYDELDAWLNSTSIAAVRSEVKTAFGGTGGNLYKTLNWRNLGISASASEEYYRSGASDQAPTDSVINASLKNLLYYGAPMSDLALFLIPNDTRGLNKVMAPTKRTQGSNTYIGVNQHAVDGNKGMTIDGKKRGYCINDGASMPHLGEQGAMVYEINGTDEGGIRSAMGYAFWTIYMVNCMLLPMAANGNTVLSDDGVDDFLERWAQAKDIMQFFDENDYNSIAHAKSKKNGGPGPIIWSDDRDAWTPDIQFFFWDAILGIARAGAE